MIKTSSAGNCFISLAKLCQSLVFTLATEIRVSPTNNPANAAGLSSATADNSLCTLGLKGVIPRLVSAEVLSGENCQLRVSKIKLEIYWLSACLVFMVILSLPICPISARLTSCQSRVTLPATLTISLLLLSLALPAIELGAISPITGFTPGTPIKNIR